MAGQQRGPRNPSTRGDFTGNQKQVLLKQHEEAVDARRDEIGLIAEDNRQLRDDGIIDMMTGEPRAELPSRVDEDLIVGEDEQGRPTVLERPEEPAPQGTRLGGSETSIDVFELPQEKAVAAAPAGHEPDEQAMNRPATIRAEYDLEDITIGYGNTFTFKQGYRYRVPRWVAAHLEEKSLVTVLSLESV